VPGGFKDFVEHMVEKGSYVRNESISAAPFDFRYSPRSNVNWMKDTKSLIEELYSRNENTKVVAVS
jgi:hypothetical protein